MRIAFAFFLALHALIHLLGPAKAFGWTEVSPLHSSISAVSGLLWLVASLLLLVGAVAAATRGAWW